MKADLLIAEADPELREEYERIFRDLGIRVTTVADGQTCWDKLLECTPDVLVLDMEIRWGGGDGVLACLREERSSTSFPKVFITGHDSPSLLSKRLGIPAANCFQKPFGPSQLLEAICAVIDADAKTASPMESAGHLS